MASMAPFGLTMNVFAGTQTGGGYTVHDQINPSPGFVTGTGYSAQVGGSSISQVVTGGGYSSYGGGYFTPATALDICPNIVGIQTSIPGGMILSGGICVTPAIGGGGGGGGSGNIPLVVNGNGDNRTFPQIVAVTATGSSPYRADPFPDHRIDVLDFNVIMVNWGKKSGDGIAKKCGDKILADINCDSIVDVLDFNLLMVYWGRPVDFIKNK